MIQSRSTRVLVITLLALACLVFLLPVAWIAITSLKPTPEIYGIDPAGQPVPLRILPSHLTLEHYTHVATKMTDFQLYLLNTIRVTASTIALVTLCSAMCGYALARLRFPGANLFITALLLIMSLPWVILLIPIYRMEIQLHLLDTLPGLIMPYTALFLPTAILIMRAGFLAAPPELREAARIDGAGEWRTFSEVMLPLAGPSMMVVMLTTFLSCWQEFTIAITLNSHPAATTLAVGITYLQDEASSFAFGPLSAAIMLAIAPLLIAFLFFQRKIVGGLAEGALKG